MKLKKTITQCSACGANEKTHADRDFIKDSEGLVLCESCINFFYLAKEQINLSRGQVKTKSSGVALPEKLPSPQDIYNFLTSKVISQDEAKKSLAIAVAHHYRRLKDPEIGKSNILLIGPTGTGKTELGRSLSELLQVPFVSADATSFTSKGYVGDDVDSIILRLLASCNWDLEKAEQGIIFIDEIDKVARRGNSDHQVGTVAVQQELLRLIEGSEVKVNVPNPQSPTGHDSIYVNTSKILFICAGAFVGLDEIVTRQNSRPLGISNVSAQQLDTAWTLQLESKHLIQYGIIPEFLGRLPVIATTHKLSKNDLIKILTDVNNSIVDQYKRLFAQDQVEVVFSQEFLDHIADLAILKDLGARGLRQILENKMKPIFFEINKYSGKKIEIFKDQIKTFPQSEKKSKVKGDKKTST